jgi:tellurite resistance protein TerC
MTQQPRSSGNEASPPTKSTSITREFATGLGVVAALVMRALMIWLGIYLLQRFHWVIYPFAALLLIAALRLLFGESAERRLVKESCAACSTWVARLMPVSPVAQGQRFLAGR